MVVRQIISSVKKDFLTTFQIPLPGFPISYAIDNITTHCELIYEKTILVFGKYDLVFCCPSTVKEFAPGYSTAVLTRTFCEPILVTGSDILEMLPGDSTDIQAVFGQPLHVRIKLGKPSPSRFWDLLKSLFLRQTWVEVFLGGQITAVIAIVRESGHVPGYRNLEPETGESLPQTGTITAAAQDGVSVQQKGADIDLEKMIDLKKIAEMVEKIIDQRQEERASKDRAELRDLREPGPGGSSKPEAALAAPGEPDVLSAAKVTELVLNILHAREAARARQKQHRMHYPPAIDHLAHFNAPHPEGAWHAPAGGGYMSAPTLTSAGAGVAPVQMPLEQIPGRPGFQPVINNPPPKPPDAGG
jgi:hypothetical protein